jgi:hypothetical protein
MFSARFWVNHRACPRVVVRARVQITFRTWARSRSSTSAKVWDRVRVRFRIKVRFMIMFKFRNKFGCHSCLCLSFIQG